MALQDHVTDLNHYISSTTVSMATKLNGSRDKIKPFYLHYYSAYDHQIWHGGDLLFGAPIAVVT